MRNVLEVCAVLVGSAQLRPSRSFCAYVVRNTMSGSDSDHEDVLADLKKAQLTLYSGGTPPDASAYFTEALTSQISGRDLDIIINSQKEA